MRTVGGIFSFLLIFCLFQACSSGGDSDAGFMVDFSYHDGQDENHVVFTNQSTGEYYSMAWDFGNNTTESTTNKTKTFEIYYPQAGDYNVSLTVKDNSGSSSVKTQVVTISEDDPNFDDSMTLVWSDEFDGSSINMSNWTFETGAGGWGNNELQNYTNGDNAKIVNGKLVITAKKVNDSKVAGSYSSTRMITWNKQEFTYGKLEVRAKLPSGTGTWPAIWMLGANLNTVGWPACGEIDIMEYVGYQPNVVHSSLHTPSSYGNTVNHKSLNLETAEEEFHVYGIIWTEKSIDFYIDDANDIFYSYAPSVKTASNWPFDKPQFFILNIAVGGIWGGAQGIDNTIFPQTMEVDYVRVYQ